MFFLLLIFIPVSFQNGTKTLFTILSFTLLAKCYLPILDRSNYSLLFDEVYCATRKFPQSSESPQQHFITSLSETKSGIKLTTKSSCEELQNNSEKKLGMRRLKNISKSYRMHSTQSYACPFLLDVCGVHC